MSEVLRGTASWTFVPLGLFPLLAELALKVAIVVLVAAGLGFALRRRSAATRHAVWSATFAAMLVLSAVVATNVKWRIVPNPRIPELPSVGVRVVERGGTAAGRVPMAVATGRRPATSQPAGNVSALHGRGAGRNWTRWLAALWLAGLLAIVVRYAMGTLGIRQWRRTGRELNDDGWSAAVANARAIVGDVPAPRVLESAATAVPMVWGRRAPVVFLPPAANAWNGECRTMVLTHELAHVRRGDVSIEAMVQLVSALLWFHPAVWYAARRLRLERERACDSVVLSGGARPSVYGRHLLAVAGGAAAQSPPPIVAMCMARKRDLTYRLESLLDATTVHTTAATRVRDAVRMSLAACVIVVGPLAWRTPILRSSVPARSSLVFEQGPRAGTPRLIFAGSEVEARRLLDSIRLHRPRPAR